MINDVSQDAADFLIQSQACPITRDRFFSSFFFSFEISLISNHRQIQDTLQLSNNYNYTYFFSAKSFLFIDLIAHYQISDRSRL